MDPCVVIIIDSNNDSRVRNNAFVRFDWIFFVPSFKNISASGLSNDPPTPIQQGANSNIPLCLTALSSVEAVTQWLGRNRFGHLLQNFRNYNGRDLLRLSKDDLVSVCGLSEGIRLYNDIHMAPVAPRMTLYIAMKDGQVGDIWFCSKNKFWNIDRKIEYSSKF